MNVQTVDARARIRILLVGLTDGQAETLAAGLAPIQMVRASSVAEAMTVLPSVLPLAVAVSTTANEDEIRALSDLARTCASEVVHVWPGDEGRLLLDAVFEAVRRSDARRAS